ncbi:MAG: hypothetical protein PHH14_04290, partial [Candidatus Margulisbacteria bacterium]|nr:hypothetical protein [Candidatus Margulisiibacteriota bacterium]
MNSRIQPLTAGKAKEPLTIIKQASRLNPQASPTGSKILADNPALFLHDLIAITLNEEVERERIVRLSGGNNNSSLIRCFSPEGAPVYLAEAEISAAPETVTVPADYPNPLLNLRIFGQRITLEGELLKKGWLKPTPESPGHGYRVYQLPRQGEKIIRQTNLVLAHHAFYSQRRQPAGQLVDFGAAF